MTLPSFEVTVGDCVAVMRGLPECSVDAVVCDPPYGLEFMGKDWDAPWKGKAAKEFNDIEPGTLGGFSRLPNHSRVNNVKCLDCDKWKFSSNPCACERPRFPDARGQSMRAFQEWCEVWAVEALRVLKPGGHLLAFGGTRTFHRMTVAIEDAGFEVRDCLSWLYGSGFPKSLNIGKAIDKAAGAEREVLRQRTYELTDGGGYSGNLNTSKPRSESAEITAPATPEAVRWEGWGTALKPAWEPIVLARKPLVGTVAANVLEHGTGGLNIDDCRIGSEILPGQKRGDSVNTAFMSGGDTPEREGRWPANVLLDEDAAAILDKQSGVSKDGVAVKRNGVTSNGVTGWGKAPAGTPDAGGYGGSGGASRFFYVAKASRRDRNEGLDGMEPKRETDRIRDDGVGGDNPRNRSNNAKVNHHPTVKPTTLMRHLVRLVTPPDGLILDPFCGSGSTGKAAMLEGFRFHGIEQDAEYAEIARRRIGWAAEEAARQPPTLGV